MSYWGLRQNAFSLYNFVNNSKSGSLKVLCQKVSNLEHNASGVCQKTEKINFRELPSASWLFVIEGSLLNDQNSTNSTKYVV
jgi:hypothetical protein